MSLPEEIKPREVTPLREKKIVLGLTASSAVYRSIDLARELIRLGASVRAVMTRASTRLIGPDLVYWATGWEPFIESTGRTEHIDLARWGDAMVIAPATLNTMGKIASGVLDELLHLTAATMMGDGKRVVFVPAMNLRLYNSPQYKRVEETLRSYGAVVIRPMIEEGKAKYPPLQDLVHCVEAAVNRGADLEGRRVLVTAGATVEKIDPVRVITNPSSGLMGVLVAREAACRGAVVDLVYGRMSLPPPYNVNKYYAEETSDMASIVKELTAKHVYDAAVFAAAPADYKPLEKSPTKIPTSRTERLTLTLVPTEKVIASMSKRPKIVVAFAAETSSGRELAERGAAKLTEYQADLMVAHNVLTRGAGFSESYLDTVLITPSDVRELGLVHKLELARYIVDFVSGRLPK